MHILIKKQKRYWIPSAEAEVEDTFIIEDDILSIDAGDFACVKLDFGDKVQCSWWDGEENEFEDCTITSIEDDLFVVEGSSGNQSKASVEHIRLRVKDYKGRLIDPEDGFQHCAPKMLEIISGSVKEEPKAPEPTPVAEEQGSNVASDIPTSNQKSFSVEFNGLSDPGTKIKVIKVIREVTGLGLKDAKALVEEPPGLIKKSVNKDTAEQIKNSLEALGGKVTIKEGVGEPVQQELQTVQSTVESAPVVEVSESQQSNSAFNVEGGVVQLLLCFLLPPAAVWKKGCGSVIVVWILTAFGWWPGVLAALWMSRKSND